MTCNLCGKLIANESDATPDDDPVVSFAGECHTWCAEELKDDFARMDAEDRMDDLRHETQGGQA